LRFYGIKLWYQSALRQVCIPFFGLEILVSLRIGLTTSQKKLKAAGRLDMMVEEERDDPPEFRNHWHILA
jgi:hypothetical protein